MGRCASDNPQNAPMLLRKTSRKEECRPGMYAWASSTNKEIMVSVRKQERKPEEVVREVCGLRPNEKLFPRMVEVVRRVQEDSKDE